MRIGKLESNLIVLIVIYFCHKIKVKCQILILFNKIVVFVLIFKCKLNVSFIRKHFYNVNRLYNLSVIQNMYTQRGTTIINQN